MSNPVVATYVVAVENPIPAGGNGIPTNTITGGSPGSDCPAASNCTTSNPTAGYTIVKTTSAGTGPVAAGSTLTYTLALTNTTSVALPAVTVTSSAQPTFCGTQLRSDSECAARERIVRPRERRFHGGMGAN